MVPPRVGACLGGSPAGGPWPGGLDRGLRADLSNVLVSSTGALQGTQSFSIAGCIGEDSETECRALVESFVGRCGTDRLQLSVRETKELVVDCRRSGMRSPPTPNWMAWRHRALR